MMGGVIYRSEVQVPRREQFPDALRACAERVRLEGIGTEKAPIVMGWVVLANRLPREQFTEDHRVWLQNNGFEASRNRRKWVRTDKVSVAPTDAGAGAA